MTGVPLNVLLSPSPSQMRYDKSPSQLQRHATESAVFPLSTDLVFRIPHVLQLTYSPNFAFSSLMFTGLSIQPPLCSEAVTLTCPCMRSPRSSVDSCSRTLVFNPPFRSEFLVFTNSYVQLTQFNSPHPSKPRYTRIICEQYSLSRL